MKPLPRIFLLIPLLLVAAFHAAIARAERPEEVIVTGFGAYVSHPTNPSLSIGQGVVRLLRENGIRAKFCELPVTYDGAFPAARDCLDASARGKSRRAPRFILALGSGSFFCTGAELELFASNAMNGKPADNAGKVATREPIEKDGPLTATIPYDAGRMLSFLGPNERRWMDTSDDAGTFVCNALAYQMSRHLEKTPAYANTPFAFAHVPSDACESNYQDPDLWAPLFAKMLLGYLGHPARTPLEARFTPPPPEPIHWVKPKLEPLSLPPRPVPTYAPRPVELPERRLPLRSP